MKRLLLLALPALLAGCTKPQSSAETAPSAPAPTQETPAAEATPAATTPEVATPAPPTPMATAGAAVGKADFKQVATIRAAAVLPRHRWRLTDANDASGQRIEALFARAGKPVTLEFKSGRLTIVNTCNRMGGTYNVRGRQLTVGKLASTMMACTDAKLMALDAEVGKRLQGELGLRMTKGDAPPQLELKSAAGDVLVFASMAPPAGKSGEAPPKQANR